MSGRVTLAPFDAPRHRDLLDRWARAPHVRRWWGDPDAVLVELATPPLGGGEALIALDGEPVGYVRWQVPANEEFAAAGLLGELPEGVIDIGIGIGVPDLVGRGIGSRALVMLARHIMAEAAPPALMIAAATANARAIHAYEKAGFIRRITFDDPDFGPMWLFVMGDDE